MAASVAWRTVIARVTSATSVSRCAGASACRTAIRLRRSESLIRRRAIVVAPGRSVAVRLAGQVEHPLERHERVGLGVGVDGDPVDHGAGDQALEGPDEVREVDAVHRRAVADVAVEEDDRLVGVGVGEALDQVELGADGPHRAGLGGLDGLDDELGGADQVGLEHDLVLALGVDQHVDAGVLDAQLVDDVLGEAAVDRAVALPEDHPRLPELLGGQAAAGLQRVPHDALVEADAHLEDRGVAAEVLVGQEEDLGALVEVGLLRERPVQRDVGVGRGADDPAVAPAERLDVGAGVHVGHRDDGVLDARVGHRVPGVLDLAQAGHVGHRAAGGEVGEDHLLARRGEDVGGLGHEVDAAEDDELRVRARGCVAGQLEGVAGDVGELDDLVPLVVVAEDEDPLAQRLLGRARPGDQVGVGRRRQVAGTLHAALGVEVAALAEGEERQVDDARGGHPSS